MKNEIDKIKKSIEISKSHIMQECVLLAVRISGYNDKPFTELSAIEKDNVKHLIAQITECSIGSVDLYIRNPERMGYQKLHELHLVLIKLSK